MDKGTLSILILLLGAIVGSESRERVTNMEII